MSISGLFLSYLVVASLLLWRRVTNGIFMYADGDETINTIGAKLVWGPFHVPGIWGILINIFSIIYLVIAVFFSFWPQVTPVTLQTMNFSCVGTVAVITLSMVYYYVRARYVYDGPIVETADQK